MHDLNTEVWATGVRELRRRARRIWGDDRLDLDAIIVRLGVTFGDVCRIARGASKDLPSTLTARDEDLKKELGNLIFSLIRWCQDLGFDPVACIELAIKSQEKFVAENPLR